VRQALHVDSFDPAAVRRFCMPWLLDPFCFLSACPRPVPVAVCSLLASDVLCLLCPYVASFASYVLMSSYVQRVDGDDERHELGQLHTVSRRRRVSEQALLAARIERCVSAGSIKRGAAALNAETLADESDPAVLAKLRDLHPGADPPAALAIHAPALEVSAETLVAVCKRVSAHNRGTADGPSGWTYEMICACVQASKDGMRAALRFINLLLSGSLPRSGFVLESVMVGLQKLTDGAPQWGHAADRNKQGLVQIGHAVWTDRCRCRSGSRPGTSASGGWYRGGCRCS
jgi:hypothetical protein